MGFAIVAEPLLRFFSNIYSNDFTVVLVVEFQCMNDHQIGSRRPEPLHAPAQNMAQNNNMQPVAAEAEQVQLHAPPSPEDFTISVEQVREHFRSKGLSKSKDTVQRWCRTGELACRKRGVLNRYFTTEASLLVLERKLLPDMIAEGVGSRPSATSVQPDAAAIPEVNSGTPLHEVVGAPARSETPEHENVQVKAHAAAPGQDVSLQTAAPDALRLKAENEGLREQLKFRDEQIEFLHEEIRSAREQRGAVVQISNRMLETLEAIAIGGRLERPKSTEPVRYPHTREEGSEVQ